MRNPTTERQDAAKRNSVADSQSASRRADGKKSNSGCVPSNEYLYAFVDWFDDWIDNNTLYPTKL